MVQSPLPSRASSFLRALRITTEKRTARMRVIRSGVGCDPLVGGIHPATDFVADAVGHTVLRLQAEHVGGHLDGGVGYQVGGVQRPAGDAVTAPGEPVAGLASRRRQPRTAARWQMTAVGLLGFQG